MAGSNNPPYTSVFRANTTHRITRNRQPVSCTACQKRKSKCDRQHPCNACSSRGAPDKCHFGAAPGSSTTSNGNGIAAVVAGSGRQQEVQARLTQLEEIVRGLAADGEKDSRVRDVIMKDGEDDVERGNQLQEGQGDGLYVDRSEEEYLGATSWSAVVEGLHDIQSLLKDIEHTPAKSLPKPDLPSLPVCPLVAASSLSVTDIVEALPSRQEADRLIAAYFNAKFVTVMFIHTHQFRRKYETFWENPKSACYLWVSILFSVLCIGKAVTEIKGGGVASADTKYTKEVYMGFAARCYVAGEYTRAKPFSVEALLMHAHSRNICHPDSDPTTWQYYGMAARLAQRQGLHRETEKLSHQIACAGGGVDGKGDGKVTKGTPFQAEMRRRIWFTVQSSDLMHSFQNGLPSLIDDAVCDTLPPTNLTDDDFDQDTKELPPARPETDPIPQLVWIWKAKYCVVLRKVLRHALLVTPQSYHDTLTLHHELEQVHNELPACLRNRSIKSSSFTDQAYTIMHRIMLDVLYLKTLCLLHRPYLSAAYRADPQYEVSRRVALDAAVKLMEIHSELDAEVQVNGRLYEDRFMLGALTLHSFLVAAMVICVDLCEEGHSGEHRAERIALLQHAAKIWTSRSKVSKDALHASRVLHVILNRLENTSSTSSTSSQTHASLNTTPTSSSTTPPSTTVPYATLNSTFSHPALQPYDQNLMKDGFDFWPGTDFDWASMDSFIRNQDAGVGEVWDFGDPTAGVGM